MPVSLACVERLIASPVPPCPPRQAHLLLLAHLDRETAEVPSVLQPDLKFVLQKTPVLLDEMLKIAAALPRPPHGYGWMVRSDGSIPLRRGEGGMGKAGEV